MVGVIVVISVFRGHKSKVTYVTETAEKQTLVQTVTATGSIQSPTEVSLLFEQVGTIKAIAVEVGDVVAEGRLLAALVATELEIQKREQENSVRLAQANLDKLLEGATGTEVNVARSKLASAQTAYNNAVAARSEVELTTAQDVRTAEVALSSIQQQTAEDVTAKSQVLLDAQQQLDNTMLSKEQDITQSEGDARVVLQDALFDLTISYNALDDIFRDVDISDVFSVLDAAQRLAVEEVFADLDVRVDGSKDAVATAQGIKNSTTLNTAFVATLSALRDTSTALLEMFGALGATITNTAYTATDLATDKTDIKNAQTAINVALTNVQNAQDTVQDAYLSYTTSVDAEQTKINAAENAYDLSVINRDTKVRNTEQDLAGVKQFAAQKIQSATSSMTENERNVQLAQSELNNILAPVRTSDREARTAELDRAQSALERIEEEIADLQLLSPTAGTITAINFEKGERTNAATPVVSLVGDTGLEIEVDIAESDIAKVVESDPVEVTFDAFGDEYLFPARVYFIEPAETVIEGVVYYRVKARILFPDEEYQNGFVVAHDLPPYPQVPKETFKPGMTANVTIYTAKKENVLTIPQRAVILKNDERLVRVLQKDATVTEVQVRLGLRGDNGLVEVLDGVKEGDQVVTFVQEEK